MTENMNDATMLRETICELREEIYLYSTDKSSKGLRKLQHELETSFYRLVEVEETSRVEDAKRQAVESGLVITPTPVNEYEECPLCFEDMPNWQSDPCIKDTSNSQRFICCSKVSCRKCIAEFDKVEREAGNMQIRCPFCRAVQPRDVDAFNEIIVRNAQAGRAFAQHELGSAHFREWRDNRENLDAKHQAMHWLTMAANQGDVNAQHMLGVIYYYDSAPKSNDLAMEHLLPAARNGHASAQYLYATILRERDARDENAIMWYTLAAAQNHPYAQESLGELFILDGSCDEAEIVGLERTFKCWYWTRKAALQGKRKAQETMAGIMMGIKFEMFGAADLLGYSCLPEVFFWRRQAAANGNYTSSGNSSDIGLLLNPSLSEESSCLSCSRCGKTEGSAQIGTGASEASVRIKRCAQCHSVGYCSEDCQRKHWKMGHKADCCQVIALEKAALECYNPCFERLS
jgi:MYND finger/Sel1 repeat